MFTAQASTQLIDQKLHVTDWDIKLYSFAPRKTPLITRGVRRTRFTASRRSWHRWPRLQPHTCRRATPFRCAQSPSPRGRAGASAGHVEAVGGPMGQERCEEVTALPRGPVPEADHAARHLAQEMRQTGTHSGRVAGAVRAVAVALALRGQGGTRRARLPGPPLLASGSLASGGRRPDGTGQGIDAGFLEAEEALALGRGPLVSAGQVASRQRGMAAASRGRARRAGVCGRQRRAWHKRPTGRGWPAPLHARRSTAALRPRVHTGPRKPSAAAPRGQPVSRRASCAAESRRGAPGVARGRRAAHTDARHPLADCRFADTQRLGDLALGPALLLELPGLEPSRFFPMGR